MCRYCGAALIVEGGAPAKYLDEVHYAVVARIGPSNVQRVTAALEVHAALAAEEAAALARSGACEIDTGTDEPRAREVARALLDAGASAEVSSRVVRVPVAPDVAVLLDGAGSHKLAVIHALRQHVDLGVSEAKRLVESAPCVLVSAISASKGAALLAALQAAGAQARVRALS